MKAVMTVRLELKPDIEANLAAQARARGIPLDAYLQRVIEDLAREIPVRLTAFRNCGRRWTLWQKWDAI
jgi:hypothetical protein